MKTAKSYISEGSNYSIALGDLNIIGKNALYSIALGTSNIIDNGTKYASILGYKNTVNLNNGTAIGILNTVNNFNSIAIGTGLTIDGYNRETAGNIIIGKGGTLAKDSLFAISTALSDKNNAGNILSDTIRYPFEVKKDNSVYLRGSNLILETDNEPSQDNHLITKKYVDDKVVSKYTQLEDRPIEILPYTEKLNNITNTTQKICAVNVADLKANTTYMCPNNCGRLGLKYTKLDNTEISFYLSYNTNNLIIQTGYKDDKKIEILIDGVVHTVTFKTATEEPKVEKTVRYLTDKNTVEFTPTSDYQPSTKKYVDDTVVFKKLSSILESASDGQKMLNAEKFEDSKIYYFINDINKGATTLIPIYLYKNGEKNNTIIIYPNDRFITMSYKPTSNEFFCFSDMQSIKFNLVDKTREYNTSRSVTKKISAEQVLTKTNTTAFTPTSDYHPTTKKYVDDKVVGLATEKYVDDAIVQNDNMNNLKLVLGDNNTIKLMFGSKELSSITINGGGTVDPTIPKTYTITNSLSNATNSNSTASVKEGSSYSANITANSNYIITNVTVTMGGVDVTNAVYSNGKINISSVTGNIVITVTTKYDTSGGGTNPPVPDEDLSKLEGILKDRLLVWHDEFDGQTLDTSKWRYATANSGGSEQQAYTVARTENTRLENSNLILEARKDGYVNNWTWSSGRIDTSGLAGFKYGRLEAKLKYDVVSGAFPAFWTIGTCAYYPTGENIHGVYKSKGTQWAQNGEIDMFEGRGTNSEIAQGGFYNKDDGKGNLSIIFGRKNIDASQYHVYAVEWTETTIISYIDGVETGRSDISDIESWHRPMYIILNMAVGSTGGYPADDCTSIKMAVDWVRVYAPKSVTKKVNVESISLTQNNLSFNMGDDPVDVYYTVNPTTAWDNNVNYESNNTSVAEVYGSRIYPKGIGNCKITARATNGVTATINVTVSQNASINSSSIALDKNTLEIYKGTNSTLIATATPGNHTDSILWKSSNDTVATVANGVVTGKGTGNCTITAYSSANSSVKAECSVSVKASAQLSGHPTSGLTLQLDRNGMSSTSWTNAVDNTVLQWKVANNNSSDIAPYMVFDGDSFYWAGANYKDHLTLDGFKNYYDFGESQTIILAGDFTNAVNPIFSNKQKLSQKDNLACMNKNGMSYSNASGGGLGSINLTTSEPNYNINGCIALRYNKSSLRADTDTMAFTSDTVNNKHVVLSSAFSQGSYPALLGNIGTAKIYWKVVLVYNRVLSDTEVQTAMRAIKTFLNS